LLLFSEGKGSLLYFLKAKGWASSLSAGVGSGGSQRSSYAYIFEMSIRLTDSGLKNVCRLSSVSDSVHILDGRSSISFSQSAPFYFCGNLIFFNSKLYDSKDPMKI
jgi:secreted Zn-dependent insulinase-like peptidase